MGLTDDKDRVVEPHLAQGVECGSDIPGVPDLPARRLDTRLKMCIRDSAGRGGPVSAGAVYPFLCCGSGKGYSGKPEQGLRPGADPVSYTHLDVYKRQVMGGSKHAPR